jgi:uncharacterized membrane protein YphA (DoxX/SURF4 family)/peroxiredoxin
MKNIITQFSRIFVGILFIISGLIKLNDPVGFSYKLAEYFGESVLNIPFLEPYALALAVFVVIAEVILGVMLLVAYQPKFTVWSLLLMIVFFTFLTFYSAFYNKVTDCGCFGDALKLKPWESFAKDIVLLFFILILFFNIKLIKPFLKSSTTNILVYLSVILCAFMGFWVLNHLPLKDFRAFKVGANIEEGMAIPENAPKRVVEMIFVYDVAGKKTEFKEADLMEIPEGATFVERKDNVISEGYVPPIHDFTMELNGSDYKEELLVEPKLLVFVAYDLEKADDAGMKKLETLAAQAKEKGYKVIGMTGSTNENIAKAKKQYSLDFDFYFCDPTTLKTIERANPSIVLVEKGTITQKLHYNDSADLKL